MNYQRIREWIRRRWRLVVYLLSFVVIVAVQTVLYWWGMAALENDPRTLLESLNVVVQSLTTTGYGQDAPWESTMVSALVIIMQFTGVAYLFIAFPLFVIPWLREAVGKPRAPETIGDLEDHVVFFRDSPLFATVQDELEIHDMAYVILEDDEDLAQDLYNRNVPVVYAEPDDEETLQAVDVRDAKSIVIDARDTDGIGAVLTVREVTDDVPIICLIEDPDRSQYLRYAGASQIISPKHRLGKVLADRARNAITTDEDVRDTLESLEVDIEIVELPVTRESPIHGSPLSELDEIEEAGATLIGGWIGGQFVTKLQGEHVVDHNTVLVVAGTEAQLDRVQRITNAEPRILPDGAVIIAGYGIVGTTADGILRKAGVETIEIDIDNSENADIIGDATDAEVLPEAKIEDAGTVLLTLSDDEAAIRATLVASQRHDVEVMVAATDDANVSKLYSAGADYVIALPQLAGQMILHELYDEPPLSPQKKVRLTMADTRDFAGDHLTELEERLNSVVVAVRRDGSTSTDFDRDFEIDAEDEIIVARPVGDTDDSR